MINTPRTAADPVMNQIAKQLIDVQWQFDLTTDEQNACLELEHNQMAPRRLINLLRDYKTWVIRMYIAGAQRTFGYYSQEETGNLYPAFRYADMIKMYFWHYKRRDAYEPADGDLNISAERAKNDLIHEIEVVQIIKACEAHLQSTGAILSPKALEQQLQEKVARQRVGPTLKGSLTDMAEVHRLALAKVNTALAGITERFDRLERLIQKPNGCLNTPAPTTFLPPATLAPPLPPPGYTQVTCAVAEEEVEAAPCS